MKEVEIVKARDGQEYELERNTVGSVVTARILRKGLPVGYAKLILHDKIATLQDILIFDDAPNSSWIIRWISPKLLTKNFRGKGFGTVLLSSVCDYVRRAGVEQVVGKMVGDIDRLKNWYRRAGFIVDRRSKAISKELY